MNARPSTKKLRRGETAREKVGLNQEEYADFCKVSKSNLALIETQRRDWPSESFLIHHKFSQLVAEAEKVPLPDLPSFESLSEGAKMDTSILQLSLQKEYVKLYEALEKERHRYESAFRLNQICQTLKQEHPASDRSIPSLLVEAWEAQSAQVMASIPTWSWPIREMELNQLQQRIDLLRQYAGEEVWLKRK